MQTKIEHEKVSPNDDLGVVVIVLSILRSTLNPIEVNDRLKGNF